MHMSWHCLQLSIIHHSSPQTPIKSRVFGTPLQSPPPHLPFKPLGTIIYTGVQSHIVPIPIIGRINTSRSVSPYRHQYIPMFWRRRRRGNHNEGRGERRRNKKEEGSKREEVVEEEDKGERGMKKRSWRKSKKGKKRWSSGGARRKKKKQWRWKRRKRRRGSILGR